MNFQRGEFLAFVRHGHAAVRVRKRPLTGVVLMWGRRRRRPLPFFVMFSWDHDDYTDGWTWSRGRRIMRMI